MTDHNTIYIIDSDDEVQTLLPTPRQDSSVIDLEAEHIDLTQDDELPEKETKQDTMPVKKAIPTTSNTPKNPIPSNSAKKSSGKIVSAAISEVSALISSKKGSALVVPQKWNSASNLEERSSNAQLRKLITPGPQQKLSLSRSALLRTNSASKKSIRPAAVPLKRTMDAAGESLLKSPERRPPPPPMTRRTPPPPPPMTRTPPPPPPPTQRRYKTSSSPFSKPTVPAVIRNHNIHEDDIDLDSFMNRITAGRKVATASVRRPITLLFRSYRLNKYFILFIDRSRIDQYDVPDLQESVPKKRPCRSCI